jgi:hypothetical protein
MDMAEEVLGMLTLLSEMLRVVVAVEALLVPMEATAADPLAAMEEVVVMEVMEVTLLTD